MKYFKTNTLIIEFPTSFLGTATNARTKWACAWTRLGGIDKVRFIEKGSKYSHKGKTYRKDMILIDVDCNKETFIDEISRFFSEKLNVNPHNLKFRFEKYAPFGNLNVFSKKRRFINKGFNGEKTYELLIKEVGSSTIDLKKYYKGSTLNKIIDILETAE